MAKTSFQTGTVSNSSWRVWKSHLSTFYCFCRNSIYMPRILCNRCSALHSSRSSLLLQCNVLWTLLNISAVFTNLVITYSDLFKSRHWTAFIHVRISGTALHLHIFYWKDTSPCFSYLWVAQWLLRQPVHSCWCCCASKKLRFLQRWSTCL